MDQNFWGRQITTLRRELRMSQRQLSALAKVNRSTLRRIEAGNARNDFASMEKIFQVLGFELDFIAVDAAEERRRLVAEANLCPGQRSRLAAQSLLKLTAADMLR